MITTKHLHLDVDMPLNKYTNKPLIFMTSLIVQTSAISYQQTYLISYIIYFDTSFVISQIQFY